MTHSLKGDVYEFCYLLAGNIELTPKGGEPVTYVAGDTFVPKPGWVGSGRRSRPLGRSTSPSPQIGDLR